MLTDRPLSPARTAPGREPVLRPQAVHRRDAGDAGQPLVGQTIERAGLRQLPGMFLIELDRDGTLLPGGRADRGPPRRRPPGVRRGGGIGARPAEDPRAGARHRPGLQARRPPPRALPDRGRGLHKLPERGPDDPRGAVPLHLQRRGDRGGSRRRAASRRRSATSSSGPAIPCCWKPTRRSPTSTATRATSCSSAPWKAPRLLGTTGPRSPWPSWRRWCWWWPWNG